MNNIETQNLYQSFLTERAKIKEMEKMINKNKSIFSSRNSELFRSKNSNFNKTNTIPSPPGIKSYKGKYKVKGDKRNFGSNFLKKKTHNCYSFNEKLFFFRKPDL